MAAKKPAQTGNQRYRFIRAAREAECSEDEAEIRESMRRIASAKSKPSDSGLSAKSKSKTV